MKKVLGSSLSEDFPKLIVDQASETRSELLKHWPLSPRSFEEFLREKIQSSQWEKVRKRVGSKLIVAYRRAKSGRD